MKVVHSWLKEYVGEALPEAARVEELLTFHAFEVEGTELVGEESVIEVKVLPDRASDCLSHRGIARELGSILNVPLQNDPLTVPITLPSTDKVSVAIGDTNACPRFTATLFENITIQESPQWLQQRLLALGQRPINNVVDATNYVMFALGQPMHAYDADKIPQVDGVRYLGVRFASAGETVSLLAEGGKNEDRVVTLQGTELLITAGANDGPIGLAGVKGGRFAELTPTTKHIIIEAAHFDPATIRKTARRHNILTDASKRFENAPAVQLPLYAQQMIATLLQDIAGGECQGICDVYAPKAALPPVTVSVATVRRLLGLSLAASEVEQFLLRIGAKVTTIQEGVFSVEAPFERTDLVGEENYVDEVGRLHGLSAIEGVMPTAVPLREINSLQYYSDRVRVALVELGFSEVITSSFQKKGEVQLQNALASDKSYLRDTLRSAITTVLDTNHAYADRLGLTAIRVFEIGTVFHKTSEGVSEHVALTMGVRTKGNGYTAKDDMLLRESIVALEAVLGVSGEWQLEKGVAELHFSALVASLPVPTAYHSFSKQADVTYQKVSPFPAISRDIALFVPANEQVEIVATELVNTAGALLVRHTLFDTYTKEGRTSYAFRLVFQAPDRTLTDDEVATIMEQIYHVVQQRGWEVR